MDWFKIEILTGLQKLALLGLAWTPPMETIAGTGAAWLEALEHGRLWNQERDTQRIRDAFSNVIRTRKQWPSVADFLECMPAIADKPALPRSTFTDAERLANLDRLADLAKEIGNA